MVDARLTRGAAVRDPKEPWALDERGMREKLEAALIELEGALDDLRRMRREGGPSREALGHALARLSTAQALVDEAARET